jgi:hypothetical protein
MAAATATGFLELNIAGFDKAISTAKKALVALTAVFAVFKTANFWKEGIEGAINFGNEIYHASQRMGAMDPGKMLIAQKALENAGLGAEEARTQINELVESGRSMSTLFKGADDYAQALQNATASYGSQANVLSQSAEKLSKVFEIIQSVGSKLQTFFLAMTAKFTVPLLALLRMLDEIDLAGMGAAFGDKISQAAALLIGLYKNGNIGEAMGLALKIGFMSAYNWLVNALADLFDKMREFKFNSKIFDGLELMFTGLALILGAAIRKAIAYAMEPYLGKEFGETQRGIANIETTAGKAIVKTGVSTISEQSGFAGGVVGFIKGLNTPTEEATEKLKALSDAALKTGQDFLTKGAGDQKKTKIMTEGLGSQDPYKVIASSMAKVGGGGGYMVQGMTIEARNQIKQINAANLANDIANKTLVAVEKIGTDKMKP